MSANPSLFRTVAGGSIVVTVGSVLLKLIGFAGSVVLLWKLSVYDYGLWRVLLSVLSSASLVTLPGIDTLITTDLGREVGSRNFGLYRSVITKMSLLLIGSSVVAFVVLYAVGPLVTRYTGIDMTFFLEVLSISLITATIQRIYNIAFTTHARFAYAQGISIFNALAYSCALFYLAFFSTLDLTTLVVIYTLCSALTALVFLPFFLTTLGSEILRAKSEPYSLWATLRGHGKWAIMSGYSDTLSGSVKTWIMGFLLGVDAIGIFSAATSMLSAVSGILPTTEVLSSVLPRESVDRDRMNFIFRRVCKYSLWMCAGVALGVWVVTPILVPLFLPKYDQAIPIVMLLMLSLPGIVIGGVVSNMLNVFKAQKLTVVSTAIARAISICVTLPLFSILFGLYGLVLDQLFLTYATFVFRWRAMQRYTPEIPNPFLEALTFDSYDARVVVRFRDGALNFLGFKRSV